MSEEPVGEGPVLEVTCPGCGRRTDRVQVFEAPVVVCLFVYFAWSHEKVAGCPACVRKRLWQLFVFSIPMGNLLFPIVGPLILWDISRSHSTDCPGVPQEYQDWAYLAPARAAPSARDRGKTVRLLVALLLLVVVVAVVLVVLPHLAG